MIKNDIIQDFPSLYESTLVLRDDSGQDSFYPGGNDLSDDLIAGVAKRDGSEPVEGVGSFFLRDQSKEGRFGAAPQPVDQLRVTNHFKKVHLDNRPAAREESSSETVRAWSAIRLHSEQGSL